MSDVPAAVESFAARLAELGWVTDLLAAGSLALGDHVEGVSDYDLVAVTRGPVGPAREFSLASLHATGPEVGCVYVDETRLPDLDARHPTWTHGRLVRRTLSGLSRAELVRLGFPIFGRPPRSLLPAMTDDEVRAAARAEVRGYWAWASRRPWMWLEPIFADLGLTSMARARHTIRTGQLISKTEAVEQVDAPDWLIDQLRARRGGEQSVSPRVRTAWIAWRDARRTISRIGRVD